MQVCVTAYQHSPLTDEVNVASRMEHAGVPDCINVSESTYKLVGSSYEFQEKREVDVKGKGKMFWYSACKFLDLILVIFCHILHCLRPRNWRSAVPIRSLGTVH